MSGILLSQVIATPELDQHAHVEIIDQLGQQAEHEYNTHQQDLTLHTSASQLGKTHIKVGIQSTLDALQSASILKWILISFSVVFTLSFCVQFVLARRSIRKLATLAVERANELTAINSDLTEEIMGRIEFQAQLLSKNQEIQEMNEQLEEAQNQLIQQEKLASLGQLAAGVAHEINNPVGFINSNLTMLKKYAERAMTLIATLDEIITEHSDTEAQTRLQQEKKAQKYDSLKRNMAAVIDESMEGVVRVKQIVQDLKDFSRIDEAEWQWADLHAGIDSTLNIVWNEIKYKAEVHKEYGELPNVECVPSQINQVIMNLLVNAAHAMEQNGNIIIRTAVKNNKVMIEVQDDGCGIPDEVIGKIFDPFFTTKEVGKGTGLGLSLSYGIIKKHHGDLTVDSTPGVGTTFTIILPISRNSNKEQAA
ncbi:MAG: histidine kinase [Ketobacter sp.]|nr:MAG: histidine kinase [Ketobacter sp.]